MNKEKEDAVVNETSYIKAIRDKLKAEGIIVYTIDNTIYPKVNQNAQIRFIVDCPRKKLVDSLIKQEIFYNPNQHNRSYIIIEDGEINIRIYVLHQISPKTIKEELLRALKGNWAAEWLILLNKNNLLPHFFPELASTTNVDGGPHHTETVFIHSINSLRAANSYTPILKLAILLHDVGKPIAKRIDPDSGIISFHNHDTLGATIAYKFCRRLGFTKKQTEYVVKMVRYHMYRFQEDTKDKVIKRWLFKVGKNCWQDLFKLRMADRQGHRTNNNKPVITYEMKRLRKEINRIIKENEAVFEEDLCIKRVEIRKMVGKNINIDEIITNLIGLINHDSTRNNKVWLQEYIGRIYK